MGARRAHRPDLHSRPAIDLSRYVLFFPIDFFLFLCILTAVQLCRHRQVALPMDLYYYPAAFDAHFSATTSECRA